jgi:ATP-dependent DNA helicase RecG
VLFFHYVPHVVPAQSPSSPRALQAGSFVARLLKKPQPPIEGVGKEVGKRVGESLSAKQQEILNLIRHNPHISAKRIAAKIGISTRKIEDHLRKLQIGGFLRRIGPRRGGHWEVLIQ